MTAPEPVSDALKASAERFWAKVDKSGDCWLWTEGRFRWRAADYGAFTVKGKRVAAHRVAYTLTYGAIKHTIDHLCRNTLCVRPDHLEDVDIRTNILRGTCPPADNARKSKCPRGHAYDCVDSNGGRCCLRCRREDYRRYRARKRVLRALAAVVRATP